MEINLGRACGCMGTTQAFFPPAGNTLCTPYILVSQAYYERNWYSRVTGLGTQRWALIPTSLKWGDDIYLVGLL